MMTCGFQTGGPPLGPTSQCSMLPSQQRVQWGAFMPPIRATVASRPCSWRRRAPVYLSQTDGQAWEDKTVRERQAREAREAREVLTPLQVQQMWLEVMGRSLSNTESALVADDQATVEVEMEVEVDEEGEWEEEDDDEDQEGEEFGPSLGAVAVATRASIGEKARIDSDSNSTSAALPPSERSYGVIVQEQMRRRLERLRLTEQGRVDFTTSSLSPSSSPQSEPGGRNGTAAAGYQSYKRRRAWAGVYEEDEDPVRYFVLGRPWVSLNLTSRILPSSQGFASSHLGERVLSLPRAGNATPLGCVRVAYHLRNAEVEVAETPLLERTGAFKQLPSLLRWMVQLGRPVYAPLHTLKRLCLLRLSLRRVFRLFRTAAPSRRYFLTSLAKGFYLCLLVVPFVLMLDQGLYAGMNALLGLLTGGRYELPRLGIARRLFLGSELVAPGLNM